MNVIPQRVRDGFGKLIEPLAVVFIRLHIRPNLITTVGTLVVIASATAFGLGWVRSGGLLLLVSGVFDLLDGRVARRGATRAADLRRGRVPRRPRGLAHRVVHAGARRRAWPDGQGGDRAARRARAAAGCPDPILRGREPRIVVVLALATSVTVVQRVLYVARVAGEPAVRRPPRQRDTLPGHAPALQSRKGP